MSTANEYGECWPSNEPESAIEDAPQLAVRSDSCTSHEAYVSEPLMLAGLSQS